MRPVGYGIGTVSETFCLSKRNSESGLLAIEKDQRVRSVGYGIRTVSQTYWLWKRNSDSDLCTMEKEQ